MACDRRIAIGTCDHYQCPYKDQTTHGYECVDVIEEFCECGDGCIEECPYSFAPEFQEYVTQLFSRRY